MITREELEVAKALWEEARITHALSISGLGLLKQNSTALINSIIALGFIQATAVNEFEKYKNAQLATMQSSLEAMNSREAEYANLDRLYKSQRQHSTPA